MSLDLLIECLTRKWKTMSPSNPAEEAAKEVVWALLQVAEDYRSELESSAYRNVASN